MNYVETPFLRYRFGDTSPRVLVDAVHAAPRNSDQFTGEIADAVSKQTGCNCIIATVSRDEVDLNRSPEHSKNPQAVHQYRRTIRKILESHSLLNENGRLTEPFLHLAIHGMKDTYPRDVEIGTIYGRTCSADVSRWLQDRFNQWAERFDNTVPRVEVDQCFRGDDSKAFHRLGDSRSYEGYGHNFHTFQIEFARWLRKDNRNRLIEVLSEAVLDFSATSDERWNPR